MGCLYLCAWGVWRRLGGRTGTPAGSRNWEQAWCPSVVYHMHGRVRKECIGNTKCVHRGNFHSQVSRAGGSLAPSKRTMMCLCTSYFVWTSAVTVVFSFGDVETCAPSSGFWLAHVVLAPRACSSSLVFLVSSFFFWFVSSLPFSWRRG